MLLIKPIPQLAASGEIAEIYQDIQDTFGLDTVPLLFQYLANYEAYLFFIWEKMKLNIQSREFHELALDIRTFAEKLVTEFTLHPSLKQFLEQLNVEEQEQLIDTIALLERTNVYLMLLTLDIRESMKSVSIITEQLTEYSSYHTFSTAGDHRNFTQDEIKTNNQGIQLLVPLLGHNTVVVSRYADFFSTVASVMESLKITELYLQKRVELEHTGLKAITQFVEPLGCSYQEFRKLTENKAHVPDLVYILTDLFPSQFPHLVLATALMQRVLQSTSNTLTVV